MNTSVKPLVLAVALTVAIACGLLLAQETPEAPPPPTEEEIQEGRNNAELVAKLVQYGRTNDDALALVSAARILQQMGVGVVKPGNTHDDALKSHDSEIFFNVDRILTDARSASKYSPDDEVMDKLITSIEDDGTKGYMGWLHWHYVLVYDGWRYVWVWTSHY